MYRDEILAIGEAVLVARDKGYLEAKGLGGRAHSITASYARGLEWACQQVANLEMPPEPDMSCMSPEEKERCYMGLFETLLKRVATCKSNARAKLAQGRIADFEMEVPF